MVVMLVYFEPFVERDEVDVVLHVVLILIQPLLAFLAIESILHSAHDLNVEQSEEQSHESRVDDIHHPPIEYVVLESHQHSLDLVPIIIREGLKAYLRQVELFLQRQQMVSEVVC